MPPASFRELLNKHTISQSTVSESLVARMAENAPNIYEELDARSLDIQEAPCRGRGLFAKRVIEPGSVILKVNPHLAVLDKQHLPLLCSHCMLEKEDTQEPLRRCAQCKAVWYCSQVRSFAAF